MNDPGRMRRDQVRCMLQEDFWNGIPEIAKTQGEQEGMVQKTQTSVIHELVQEPRTPVFTMCL
jgi:hypothetical protein